MAAVAVHQFAQCITCHAWSPDHSMVAFCPNNNEVHIYKLLEDKWEKVHVLQKHDQIVSGIDWSRRSNRIVTVSHDRNSWVSKLIRKKHDSSVTSVAWHPNNILLATTSTDGKCRVFSTFIKGVDTRESKTGSSSDSKFGEQIVQLDLSFSWAFGVKWSPSGNTLAYVGHNSMIYFVDDVGPSPLAQNVAFRNLPLRDVLFFSEKMVIGVGFDCTPMVFAADESGIWSFIRFLGERKASSSGPKYGSQFSEAFGKLYGQSKHGLSNDTVEPSRIRGAIHENCINCIVPLRKEGFRTKRFSTSGLDGKVVIWDLENYEDLSDYV
ncbi:actin-related protein 2/3 complex subunit 1A-like isoform X2 [Durio zibethinus]|uniref:Arp2/3 complex 41 kDa subunit n=1 Tax=Durio zibethinus TaxID=66656 RepID=A0A6P5ZE38_DURZI|nr:actin-related protein 2/3 complex subunit 1A-like isoform X2 [Durio zibethinus]